jgi:hypothetical protein
MINKEINELRAKMHPPALLRLPTQMLNLTQEYP